jgi:hypothetical protein
MGLLLRVSVPFVPMTDMLTNKTPASRSNGASTPCSQRKIRQMAPTSKTLLEPGNDAEWSRLDVEKREALTPSPETPVGELLRRGQHLSAQAASLLRAVERANGRAGS